MAALDNKIYIGSITEPIFYFENVEIESLSGEIGVDIIGGDLTYDILKIVVNYTSNYQEDLRTLPYGTPVWFYEGNLLKYKHYIKDVERAEKSKYIINTISALGILSKQYHKGGVYTGQTFSSVISEIIGSSVPYSFSEEVGETKLYGYLPYDTKMKNLHQIMFAENISISKDSNGDILFVFIRDTDTETEIPQNRIFVKGNIKYPTIATTVELTEHSYQYVDTLERITLVDNTDSSPATGQIFFFDNAPIYVPSLQASEGLSIVEAGVNYAALRGQGILTGIPYYDKTTSVSRSNSSDGEPYTKKISNITMVSAINSENVIERLVSYYSSQKKITADIKLSGEKCGGIYTFVDKFDENVRAFLTKMKINVSSFIKATGEFITGYIPSTFGNNYTNYIEVTEPCDLVVPEGCKLLKLIVIGGGDGGSSGLKPEPAEIPDGQIESATPQKGGEAGVPGESGKIREVTIVNPAPGNYSCRIGMHGVGGAICFSYESRNEGTAGTDSSVTTPSGTVYSSSDSSAYRSKYGIPNIFTGKLFGRKGKDGVKGGDGGSGASGNSDNGEDVVYKGKLYKGGKGTQSTSVKFTHIEQSAQYGSAGGEGAMAYGDGGDAVPANNIQHIDETSQRGAAAWEKFIATISFGGDSDITVPEEITERGCGGDAGNGGAGAGGESLNDYVYQDYRDNSNRIVHLEVNGGGAAPYYSIGTKRGTAGRDGGRGIIIAYSDVPLSTENINKIPAPRLEPAGNIGDTSVKLLASNLAVGETYILERNTLVDGTTDYGDPYYESRIYYHAYHRLYQFTAIAESMLIINGEGSWVLSDATYKYRIRGVGSESIGESEYSNECIAGIGRPQLAAKNIARADISFRDGKYMSYLYKPEYSGTTAYYEQRVAGELQWKYIGSLNSSSKLIYDDVTRQGEFNVYRVYFGQSGYIYSQYSDEIGVQIPAVVTNKLCTPAIYSARFYNPSDYNYDEAIQMYVHPLDERCTKIHGIYKVNDQEWKDLSTTTLPSPSGKSPVYMDFHRIPEFFIPGTVYHFKYKGINEGNFEDSDYSDEIVIAVPDKVATPVAEAAVSTDGVVISWSAVENATGYRIKKKKSTETNYSILADNLQTLSYVDESTEMGSVYEYYVIALGNQTTLYNSSRSEIVEVLT